MSVPENQVDLEVVEDTIDELAEGAKHLVRRGFQQGTATGLLIGLTVGAVTGYFIATRRLQTKYSKIADAEIAEMREHYQEKTRALEAQARKRPIEEIVKERGYASPDAKTNVAPPMAIPPPSLAIERDDEEAEEPSDNEPERPKPRNIFQEAEITHEWDYKNELPKRSPEIPYVIHYDEREEFDYDISTLTYYDGDDVLCNERDEIVDRDHRNLLIGEDNLNRFGHGSNDASVVYIRNDKLELVFEVVRTPGHFAEDVHGFSHEDFYRGNLERMWAKERDEQED